jgi:hypothetical protein
VVASSARATTQTKHVQFASPPAPETPLSYSYPSSSASSPESLRYTGSLAPSFNRPAAGAPVLADPFHSEDSDTSNERSDEQHTRDTRVEPTITPNAAQYGLNLRPAELQAFPGNVAAILEAPSADGGHSSRAVLGQISGKERQSIDVDAFKRLLLTGESGKGTSGGSTVPPVSATLSVAQGDSSSSTTDSASVSHQSIFEPNTSTLLETPRTSHELEVDDASIERRSLSSSITPPVRQRPSVPPTRHGKKLMETSSSAPAAIIGAGAGDTSSTIGPTPASYSPRASPTTDLNRPLPPPPSVDVSSPTSQSQSPEPGISFAVRTKRPPTPPLSRRQSQMKGTKPQLARSNSEKAVTEERTSPSSPTNSQKFPSMVKAPPPPPQRRLNRASTYGTPSSENQFPTSEAYPRPSGSFLADLNTGTDTVVEQVSELPSRTPSTASRSASSTGTAAPGGPPPLPPPRRMRGLSKSSTDSQRPQSSDLRRLSIESSRNVSGASNANDILADLAALQREVDALRNSQGGRKGS